MTRRRTVALAVLLSAVCLLLVLALDGGAWPAGLLALGAAVALCELRPVRVRRAGDERAVVALTVGPLVIALQLTPVAAVVLAVAAGVLLVQVVRRVPPLAAWLAVVQSATATALAVLVAQLLGGPPGALAGVVAFVALHGSLLRLADSVTTGSSWARPFQRADAVRLLYLAAVSSTGLVGVRMYQVDPLTLPAFVAPALLLLLWGEQASRRRASLTVTGALAEQATAFYGRTSEETALLVTRTARDLLDASRSEMVLLGDEAPIVFSDGPEGVRRSRLDHAELITDWRGRAFEAATAAADGAWAGVVVGRDVPRALLGVWRSPQTGSFRGRDLELLQTLADALAGWLSLEVQESGALLALRRDVLNLGGGATELADALGTLARIREALESAQDGTVDPAAVAADLREVEDHLAHVASGLVEQRTPAPASVVASGRWEV